MYGGIAVKKLPRALLALCADLQPSVNTLRNQSLLCGALTLFV